MWDRRFQSEANIINFAERILDTETATELN